MLEGHLLGVGRDGVEARIGVGFAVLRLPHTPASSSLPACCSTHRSLPAWQVNEYRRQLGMRVSGFDPPKPVKLFSQASAVLGLFLPQLNGGRGLRWSQEGGQALQAGKKWLDGSAAGARRPASRNR